MREPYGIGGGSAAPLGPQTAPRWALGCCRALRGGRISHQSPQFLPVHPKVGPGKAPWGGGGETRILPHSPPWLGTAPPAPSHPLQPPPAPLLPPFLSGSPFLPGFLTPPSSAQFNPVQPSPVRRVLLAPVPAFVPPRRGGALLSPAVDSALGPPAPSGARGAPLEPRVPVGARGGGGTNHGRGPMALQNPLGR